MPMRHARIQGGRSSLHRKRASTLRLARAECGSPSRHPPGQRQNAGQNPENSTNCATWANQARWAEGLAKTNALSLGVDQQNDAFVHVKDETGATRTAIGAVDLREQASGSSIRRGPASIVLFGSDR